VILGPTASGKTALSLALAQKFGGEIVNCDSLAMVREFDVGTAKPSAAERGLVPHHLLNVVEPTQYVTAGEYARLAREVLKEINLRGRLPIIVGGTGLYLRALLEGLFSGRSAPKISANACVRVPRNAVQIICTKCCGVSTRRPRKKFMATIPRN